MFFTGASVSSSRTYHATMQPSKVAVSLNLGRDNLYIVTDVPRLQYELEVGRCKLHCVCFLRASDEVFLSYFCLYNLKY